MGEAGVEEPLRLSIEIAVEVGVIQKSDLLEVVVDGTAQEKAVAHPTDSGLPEHAGSRLIALRKRVGIKFKQTYIKESRRLTREASGYAHFRQFRRLGKVIKRQRTIPGRLIREVERKLGTLPAAARVEVRHKLAPIMEIYRQRPTDKNKRYSLRADEVERISKGKARKRYEFSVKVGVVTSLRTGYILGTRSFPGNPYDGHTLPERSKIPPEPLGVAPHTIVTDLGYEGKEIERERCPR